MTATPGSRNITNTNSHPPRFRSGLCWLRRRSSPGLIALAWSPSRAGVLGLSSWRVGLWAPHALHLARALAAHASAVDIQRLSGDEGGIVAGQERHRADQIVRHFHALDRLHLRDAQ